MDTPGGLSYVYLSLVLTVSAFAARFSLEQTGKIARLSDPQISSDGKSIAMLVSRANYEENRFDGNLVLIDIGSRGERALTQGRPAVSMPRWVPGGTRIALLAQVEGKAQVFVLPMKGGDGWQLTRVPSGVQQYAWRPNGADIAFVATDELPKVNGEERHNKSFEIQNNHFLMQESPRPAHLWLVP